MSERYKLTPFWLRHPSVRHRSPSSTIADHFPLDISDYNVHEYAGIAYPVINSPPKRLTPSSLGDVAQIQATETQAPRRHSETGPPRRAHQNSVLFVNDVLKDAALKTYLREVFIEQIHREYPVVEFIKKVFKYSPSDIPGYHSGKMYTVPVAYFQAYSGTPEELDCYPSLKAILNDLVTQLCPQGKGRSLLGEFICMYKRQPELNTCAKLKRDFYFTADADSELQDWETTLGYLEVQRRPKEKKTICKVPAVIDLKALESEPTKYNPIIPRPVPGSKDKPIKSASPSALAGTVGIIANGASGSASEPLRQSKRKRTLETSSDEAFYRDMPSPPLQRKSREEILAIRMTTSNPPAVENSTPPSDATMPPSIALTEEELQSAKYINEMMSHGARNFGTGVLLEETDVTLWYADRMGLVQSASFDFMKKPHLLLLVLAAYTFADLPKLGLCPLLTYPCADKKFNDYTGVTLDLPVAQDIEYNEHTDLSFMIDPRSSIQTDQGTIGRGTTLIIVKPIGKAAELFGLNWYAAKLAWPTRARTGEDALIRIIRKNLKEKKPEYLRHVVDLKCSLSQDISEVGLPRWLMTDLPKLENYEPRVFRCLVMQAYSPLETIESPEEFTTIFLDTLRAHHWVFVTSGVLHQDVSPENLMYYREPDDSVRGVLCDWDLAKETMEAGSRSEEMKDDEIPLKHDEDRIVPCYRTGTAPFMALDLLEDGDPPKHRYRYDLESFFWVLVWHCAVYDPVTQTYGHIKHWESKNLILNGDTKRNFLADYQAQKRVFKRVHPLYLPIVKSWVQELMDLFRRINVTDWYELHGRISKHSKEPSDLARQEKLDHEAAECAKKRDEAITYEKFMACLGQDVSEEL